jgi:ferrous iron transport protein B
MSQRILIIGNPNCGKSALFNALTGSSVRVGNWSGVTVNCKTAHLQIDDAVFECVDLPGIYNLCQSEDSALDQIAAQRAMLTEVDLIVNVCDAANLPRNLYLTSQLCQLKKPMLLALNMTDIATKHGLNIDEKKLSAELGIPVTNIIANREIGINELKQQIKQQLQQKTIAQINIELPVQIKKFEPELNNIKSLTSNANQWFTWAALENDLSTEKRLNTIEKNTLTQIKQQIELESEESSDTWIANARHNWAHKISKLATTKIDNKCKLTEKIDKIALHKLWGIPVFFAVMYLMFVISINIGSALQDFFDISSDAIFVQGTTEVLTKVHTAPWLIAIISNGIGKGINTTITFIPVILMMFFCLSYLEDSGYLARAAFIVDRLMRAIGLPGKAFVPMIVGFGCNVPAVMGARTLNNKRDRILTILMTPFMSCGARLAIFAVFVAAFFSHGAHNLIFSLYLLGIAVAIFTAWLLRKTFLPGDCTPMVLELPEYHRPHWKSIWRHTWGRLKQFIYRAGKVIVPVCIILGFLNHISVDGKLLENTSQHSLLAASSKEITPIFKPMGVDENNWPASVGLLTGVMAKEVVVGTLNSLYAQVGHYSTQTDHNTIAQNLFLAIKSVPENLATIPAALINPISASAADDTVNSKTYDMLQSKFASKSAAIAYLIFVLLYFPCVATMAAVKRELGNKWMLISISWNTFIAYAIATAYFQINRFAHCSIWEFIFAFIIIPIVFEMSKKIYNFRDKRCLA